MWSPSVKRWARPTQSWLLHSTSSLPSRPRSMWATVLYWVFERFICDIPTFCFKVKKQLFTHSPSFSHRQTLVLSVSCLWGLFMTMPYFNHCQFFSTSVCVCSYVCVCVCVCVAFQLLNANLAKLTAKFEKATADKLKCQQEAESTARTISLANRLVRRGTVVSHRASFNTHRHTHTHSHTFLHTPSLIKKDSKVTRTCCSGDFLLFLSVCIDDSRCTLI